MQVPYWIGFDVVFRRLIMRLERLRTAALLLLALSLPPWLYYVPVALSDEYWYSSHRTCCMVTVAVLGTASDPTERPWPYHSQRPPKLTLTFSLRVTMPWPHTGTGVTESGVDVGAVMLKFHPLCYVHVFLFGMVRVAHVETPARPIWLPIARPLWLLLHGPFGSPSHGPFGRAGHMAPIARCASGRATPWLPPISPDGPTMAPK